jgi:hypothetical protein
METELKSSSIRCSQSDSSLKYLDNSHSYFLRNSVLRPSTNQKNEIHSNDISGLINFENLKLDEHQDSKDIYDFRRLQKNKPKKDLILTRFAIFFRDNYFINEIFKNDIQPYYNKFFKQGDKSLNKLKYPVKVKNLFTNNYIRLFVKPNLKLLTSKQFYKITHNYIPLENTQTESNIIHITNNFIHDQSETLIEFACEYITLEGVVFGKLYITNDYILFKSRFNHLYRDNQIEDKYITCYEYMFSSLESDIIYKEKDIKIYIKDIREVLNRRFLFMWQGHEIFLKNGKSYYFNLFKVHRNEQFFEILTEITKKSDILFIQNCKKYFKSQEYTKVNYI